MRAAIARHRGIVRVSTGRFPVGPNALLFTERALAILRAGGLSDELAVSGAHLLTVIRAGPDRAGRRGAASTTVRRADHTSH